MKKCFKCGAEKPLADFYKHSGMSDGHLNKCKECTKTDVKVHRKENDSVREYDRKRGSRRDYSKVKEYREKYPLKHEAHKTIRNLLKKGLILRPVNCESCNSEQVGKNGLHGHHDDYSKPAEVRWLCAKCHHRWHAEHGEALNPI